MKVLHVLYKLMPSGAEMMLCNATEKFRDVGVEGHILSNDDDEGEYAPQLRKAGYVIHHRIPWSSRRRHLIKFWKLCRREQFDVVHIHVIRGYWGFALAAKLAGVKTVVKTFHGNFTPSDGMRHIWHVCLRWGSKFLGVKFHAISRSVQDNEWKYYRIRCKLIWNWVDEKKFPLVDPRIGLASRKQLGIDEDKFIILSVGNCHSVSHMRIKNHRLIIEAMAKFPRDVLDKVVYLHVGREMEVFPERELARSLGVLEHIRFLGPRSDVYELLSAANLFVMSSLHEGLGNSVIEALVAGREPLLVSAPGLVDFGKVIPALRYCGMEAEDMATVLRKYLDGSNTVMDAHQLREKAVATFSLDCGVREMIGLYKGA